MPGSAVRCTTIDGAGALARRAFFCRAMCLTGREAHKEQAMTVHGLDHVNILTDHLDDTVSFYAGLLGLERRESAGARMGFSGAWMCDTTGHPIVHVVERGPDTGFADGHEPGLPTAAVHHVAFKAQGFADTLARLKDMNAACRVNDMQHAGLRQIFLTDPNNINIELNFAGD
jgi:catechol 2,3-dioxygenase-like lactoylglutathione lyase family enzyme